MWRSAFAAQWENYLAPTAADGGIWIDGGSYGGMYGFDADDGAERFYAGLEQYDQWTPAYDDGGVYTFVEGNLRAHDPDDGAVSWTLDLGWNWAGWSMATTPVVADGTVWLASSEGRYAVDVASESLLGQVDGNFFGIPAVANGVVYAITEGSVKSYDDDDGAYQSVYVGDSGLYGQPLVTDDMLIMASSSKTYIYDLATGTRLNRLDVGGWVSVADGRLYIADQSGILHVWKWMP